MNKNFWYATLSLFLLLPHFASACPDLEGMVDVNCDGRLKIVVTGDSVAYGYRDTRHKSGYGYVARLRNALPFAEVGNLGIPRITSLQLLQSFKRNLPKRPPGKTRLIASMADVIVIDVGRNDYWFNEQPATTVRNIRRLVKYLRAELNTLDGSPPLVLVATLVPTTRGYQRTFISTVNAMLLKYRANTLPTEVRFDEVSASYISYDGIHPSPKGYDAMGRIALNYLLGPAQRRCARLQHLIYPESTVDQLPAPSSTKE